MLANTVLMLTQFLAIALAATTSSTFSTSTTSAASSSATSVSSSSSFGTAQLASYYSSVSYDVVSFYEDWINNRDGYHNGNQAWFNTHVFSFGSYSSLVHELTTYTDDSFTTLIEASPQLVTALASIADQLPWHSKWVKQNPYSAEVAAAASSANSASDLVKGTIAKSSMRVAIAAMVVLTLLFGFSLV